MSTWVVVVAVGLASYVFRAGPLLVLGRVGMGPRARLVASRAGAGAVTALLVGSLGGSGQHAPGLGVLVATCVALAVAVRRASMAIVVASGATVYATIEVMRAVTS